MTVGAVEPAEAPSRGPKEAARTPEERGLARDEVRLLVSTAEGHLHARFHQLPTLLRAGDVLVVNRSGTLPAALEAWGPGGSFLLHLCTRYGPRLWLAEPRWSPSRPGPLPFSPGERIVVAGTSVTVLAPFPGIPRLRFILFDRDPLPTLASHGRPISYGYLASPPPIEAYQTVFADRPGSAEMPSAARPFSDRTLAELRGAGVELVRLTLHTGVSSLELGDLEGAALYPEPFELTAGSADRLAAAAAAGRRIIAVGTTVVRALASSWNGRGFRPTSGMTSVYVRPGVPLPPISGLLTGFHDPHATHLQMLEALAGNGLVADGYREARDGEYLWHEFGDVHLLLAG